MESPAINPSLEDHTLNKKDFNLTEDKDSSHEEQNTKINYQSCSNLNCLSIKEEDKIESIHEHQELNTTDENIIQAEEVKSPIHVRFRWEEYPVIRIMNPKREENILPFKISLSIGMKPKK
ncbi:hypothetical protein O181_007095 [Austropuccinia psidii MF-1]|uniref:Uncharacterized protein n=1 Tax=Austropuccinia psidii MF-1 TaxID=1389203 RepID=A0A9Q3GHI3_9BASI|nr:hypothetical protein [Austropuccinia psidii MF-1]